MALPVLTPPHLGGHCGITHVDAPVLQLLRDRYGVRSMLDVGCGPGGMRQVAAALGITWEGVDGDPACKAPDVIVHDYTGGGLWWSAVDLVWSVEFVEHVAPSARDNFLATFEAGRVLFMTHALPGQIGHHHVNCQPPAYWIDALQARGWTLDAEATLAARMVATDQYTRATGLVFTRGEG